jgi:hypothetical protein
MLSEEVPPKNETPTPTNFNVISDGGGLPLMIKSKNGIIVTFI